MISVDENIGRQAVCYEATGGQTYNKRLKMTRYWNMSDDNSIAISGAIFLDGIELVIIGELDCAREVFERRHLTVLSVK